MIRWSKSLFSWLNKHEEHSGLIRRIKLPVLGMFVSIIGLLGSGSICSTNCYVPLDFQPRIADASASPNPTKGADSVEVKARMYFVDHRAENEEVYIDSAACYVSAACYADGDTADMVPDDGSWGPAGSEEFVSAKLYVGDLEPGSTRIYIEVYNSEGDYDRGEDAIDLVISEE